MEEKLNKSNEMISNSTNIPEDIKKIVRIICKHYIKETEGKLPLEAIQNVCESEFEKISSDNVDFSGENKILGTTDVKYDNECNVIHKMSYLNDSNYIKLITILTHELGHVMTEFAPCSIANGSYSLVKRTTGFFTNCRYNEEGELLTTGMYGFRMSDGFLESLCSRIFMSQEFREDLKAVGYDLEDYVYKDERLFPSRVYDEYKACFELFDYIMDGQLFDFSCKKYETNEEMIADINRYRLNTIFEYLDKSNDALWKLKKFEGKESSEEFQSLLEEYKDKKSDSINLSYVLLDLYDKEMDDDIFAELLDVYRKTLDKQKLLPISTTEFGTPSM